jgi:L-lactate utilization protein LutB
MYGEEGGLKLTATTTGISTIFDSPLTSTSCAACQQKPIRLVWSNIKRAHKTSKEMNRMTDTKIHFID